MRSVLLYFRRHPWQRRAVTGSLAVILGAAIGMAAYPYVRDRRLLRDLGSEDPAVRYAATVKIRGIAASSEMTLGRLESALATESDVRFAAIAAVLELLDRFHVPGRDRLQIDRLNLLHFAGASGQGAAEMRWATLAEILLCGRDNRYLRRCLRLAASDPSAEIRRTSALLAARLADDEALTALLGDADTGVVAAAALSIGVARRTALGERVAGLLAGAAAPEVVSAAAYTLAVLDPAQHSPRICRRLNETKSEPLRSRLLSLMPLLNDAYARQAVGRVLASAQAARRYPPPSALSVAGRLRPAGASQHVQDALTDKYASGELSSDHLLAAIGAAERLGMSVEAETERIVRELWGRNLPRTLTAAVRALGRQTPSERIRRMLRWAADNPTASSRPACSSRPISGAALPSAAAAVCLWRWEDPAAEPLVRQVSQSGSADPGDYIAWHVARRGPIDRACALGLKMLPPLGAAPGLRVYNDSERAAGAMLLALAAATDSQRKQAIDRIASRLEGGPLGGEDDFRTAGTFRCALLTLGQEDQRPLVRALLADARFPRRRALTALLAAGDKQALDWLLFNPALPAGQVASILIEEGVGEVLKALAPQLPPVDAAGDDDLRRWQVEILRQCWGIRRSTVSLGTKQ